MFWTLKVLLQTRNIRFVSRNFNSKVLRQTRNIRFVSHQLNFGFELRGIGTHLSLRPLTNSTDHWRNHGYPDSHRGPGPSTTTYPQFILGVRYGGFILQLGRIGTDIGLRTHIQYPILETYVLLLHLFPRLSPLYLRPEVYLCPRDDDRYQPWLHDLPPHLTGEQGERLEWRARPLQKKNRPEWNKTGGKTTTTTTTAVNREAKNLVWNLPFLLRNWAKTIKEFLFLPRA